MRQLERIPIHCNGFSPFELMIRCASDATRQCDTHYCPTDIPQWTPRGE